MKTIFFSKPIFKIEFAILFILLFAQFGFTQEMAETPSPLIESIKLNYGVQKVDLDTLSQDNYIVSITKKGKRNYGYYGDEKMWLPPIFNYRKNHSSDNKLSLGIAGQYGVYNVSEKSWDFKMLYQNVIWFEEVKKYLVQGQNSQWRIFNETKEEIHVFDKNVKVKTNWIDNQIACETKKGENQSLSIYDLSLMKVVFEGNYKNVNPYSVSRKIWSCRDEKDNQLRIFNNGNIIKKPMHHLGMSDVVIDSLQYYIGYEKEAGMQIFDDRGSLLNQKKDFRLFPRAQVILNDNLIFESTDSLYGIINKDFEVVVPADNYMILPYVDGYLKNNSNGWSHIKLNDESKIIDSKWDKLNKASEFVHLIKDEEKDHVIMKTKKGKYLVLDSNGKEKITCDTILHLRNKGHNLVCVEKGSIKYFDENFQLLKKYKKRFKSNFNPSYQREFLNIGLVRLESDEGAFIYNLESKETKKMLTPCLPFKNNTIKNNVPFVFKENGKMGIGKLDGTVLLEATYDSIIPYNYSFLGFKERTISTIRI